MAAFDFPSSPALNQTYTPAGGPTYQWNGYAWVVVSALLTGPAFRASSALAVAATNAQFNLVKCEIENFDTDNCYNPATGRFTPNKPGYYQFNAAAMGTCAGGMTVIVAGLYKNGAIYACGDYSTIAPSPPQVTFAAQVCELIPANGTTDYFELWMFVQGTGVINIGSVGNSMYTHFSGYLARLP